MAAFRYIGDGTKLKLEWVPRRDWDPRWVQGGYRWAVYDLSNVLKYVGSGRPRKRYRVRAEASGYLHVARGERWPGAVTLEDLGFLRPEVGPSGPVSVGWARPTDQRVKRAPLLLNEMSASDAAMARTEDRERAALLGSPEAYDRVALLLRPALLRRAVPGSIREDLEKYPPHVRRTEAWCCQGHADCKEFPALGRACFFQPRAARKRR